MNIRWLLKRTVQAIALALVLPAALTSGFGRRRELYTIFSQLLASAPGLPGSFLRAAYYRLTLRQCSIDIAVGFGSFFVHPETTVGKFVSIGAYCVVGRAQIGTCTQIASHVEIPSGRHQHDRDVDGRLHGGSIYGHTVIGEHCRIGASVVVLASIGDRSTVGAGSVVVKDIPADVTAVGNPARVLDGPKISA